MSMEYVRQHYGVPAKRGRHVQAYYRRPDGTWLLAKSGRITSATHYVFVDGVPFHPTCGMVYIGDDGEILADYRGN